jgi:predicted NUDIX family NTP pyrophosphohydrolase
MSRAPVIRGHCLFGQGGILKRSAGILLYRQKPPLEVFLVHPGGPFWAKRDFGAWTIPKGGLNDSEDDLSAARREFQEETGFGIEGDFRKLGEVRYSGGKTVIAWGVEGDCDPALLRSNTCFVEWPPRSGKQLEIPEVDRGGWFSIAEARRRLLKGQLPFLDRLEKLFPGPQ